MTGKQDFDITQSNEWLAVTNDPDNAPEKWWDTVEDVERVVTNVEDGVQDAENGLMAISQIVGDLPVVRSVEIDSHGLRVYYDSAVSWDAVSVLMFVAHMEYDASMAYAHDEAIAKVAELWEYNDDFWSEVA